jgi:hypothetical protein
VRLPRFFAHRASTWRLSALGVFAGLIVDTGAYAPVERATGMHAHLNLGPFILGFVWGWR